MKRIIDGKRYNTETATLVHYEETALYRTSRGGWFLAGKGGPLSRWAQSVGQTGSCSGAGIHVITVYEARELLEVHRETAKLEEYFSDVVEDG